jgi:hypothetical protein
LVNLLFMRIVTLRRKISCGRKNERRGDLSDRSRVTELVGPNGT